MILKQGSQGADVEHLQLLLKAAGYNPGDIDGDYGPATAKAVLEFQAERPDLDDDGIAGPMTLGALDAAVAKKKPTIPAAPTAPTGPTPIPCELATWAAVQGLFAAVTKHARYGPGRGMWQGGKFLVTYGAAIVGGSVKTWPNMLGRPYSSFHCSSWTNFFLGWLLRRNEDYTHAGNIPSLFDLLENGPEVHQITGGGVYRGYGDTCSPIVADGSGVKRTGFPDAKAVDAKELLARRASLPTFVVCAQSTKRANGSWLMWHHTLLFVIDHNDNHRMYRIAADGYKDAVKGYSADPMKYVEITDANVGNYASAVFRPYGVHTTDGTYGDKTKSIAAVDFEIP
jgi:hypothetical protein